MADERFWAKVTKTDGCWLWTGALNRSGYGYVRRRPNQFLAHRYAYELVIGPIPDGMTLDHLCAVRNCVNPAHLEPVTLHENIIRSDGPAGRHARATECASGHVFTPGNTRTDARGWRVCVSCKRERDAESAQRRRDRNAQ